MFGRILLWNLSRVSLPRFIKTVLWPNVWSILENVPRLLEKNDYSAVLEYNVLYISTRSFFTFSVPQGSWVCAQGAQWYPSLLQQGYTGGRAPLSLSLLSHLPIFIYIYFFNSLYRRCSLRPPFFLRLKVCGCRLVYMWEELGSSSFYAAVLDPPPRVCFLNTNALLISKLCFLLIIPLLENLRWIHISTELQILPNSFLNLF